VHRFDGPLHFAEVAVGVEAEPGRLDVVAEIKTERLEERDHEGVGHLLVLDRVHRRDAIVGGRSQRHVRAHDGQLIFVGDVLDLLVKRGGLLGSDERLAFEVRLVDAQNDARLLIGAGR
jgi:hypothetical protein